MEHDSGSRRNVSLPGSAPSVASVQPVIYKEQCNFDVHKQWVGRSSLDAMLDACTHARDVKSRSTDKPRRTGLAIDSLLLCRCPTLCRSSRRCCRLQSSAVSSARMGTYSALSDLPETKSSDGDLTSLRQDLAAHPPPEISRTSTWFIRALPTLAAVCWLGTLTTVSETGGRTETARAQVADRPRSRLAAARNVGRRRTQSLLWHFRRRPLLVRRRVLPPPLFRPWQLRHRPFLRRVTVG